MEWGFVFALLLVIIFLLWIFGSILYSIQKSVERTEISVMNFLSEAKLKIHRSSEQVNWIYEEIEEVRKSLGLHKFDSVIWKNASLREIFLERLKRSNFDEDD